VKLITGNVQVRQVVVFSLDFNIPVGKVLVFILDLPDAVKDVLLLLLQLLNARHQDLALVVRTAAACRPSERVFQLQNPVAQALVFTEQILGELGTFLENL